MKTVIILFLRFYKKKISSLINSGYKGCRFYPSCSDYAITAINKKGVVKGGFMAVWRVLRCNPLSKGGVDEIV